MAKYINPAALDAGLNYVGASNIEHMCTAQPANYAGLAAVSVGSVVPTFTGPAAGDVSGRKITAAQKTGVAVTANGTVTHVALADTGTSTLRYVTTCTSQAVTSGGTADINAFAVELRDVA